MITDADARIITEIARRKGRRWLGFRETVEYYWYPVFIGGIALVFLAVVIQLEGWGKVHADNILIIIPSLALAAAIFIFAGKSLMRKFETASARLSPEEFRFIMKALTKYYELPCWYADGDTWVLFSSEAFSGRVITVIRCIDKVLINSMVRIELWSGSNAVIGWNSNTYNMNLLKTEIEEFAQGKSPFGTLENPAPEVKEEDIVPSFHRVSKYRMR